MAQNHTVKQGDCISSIAYEYGFFPDTIWNHPQNKELKKKRKDPNVLFPGDVVYVPDKRVKEVSKATDQMHKFRVKNTPEKLKLQLLKEGQPRADEEYELDVDGLKFSGKLDSQGRLQQSIPPNAKHGKLTLDEGQEVIKLFLGNLDPHDLISGVQGRLRHLGFFMGSIDGNVTEALVAAIQEFQISKELEPNGEIDSKTIDALKNEYGS